jgi:phosphohistidine phosphatase
MELLLVQHGVPVPQTPEIPDRERPLTPDGEKAVGHIARWAAQAGVKVEQIRHSGMKRTKQTADILAEQLKLAAGQVTEAQGLTADDKVDSIPAKLLEEQKSVTSVMLVSHQPFLGRLVGLLLVGDPKREDLVQVQRGGIICLSLQEEKWSIEWVMRPELAATFEAEQPTK